MKQNDNGGYRPALSALQWNGTTKEVQEKTPAEGLGVSPRFSSIPPRMGDQRGLNILRGGTDHDYPI